MRHEDVRQFEDAVDRMTTRRGKLERWARLVEEYAFGYLTERAPPLERLHRVEYMNRAELETAGRVSNWVGAVAYADPVFRATGLRSSSAWDVAEYFGLGMRDLHAICCDCVGCWAGAVGHHAAERIIRASRRTRLVAYLSRQWFILDGRSA